MAAMMQMHWAGKQKKLRNWLKMLWTWRKISPCMNIFALLQYYDCIVGFTCTRMVHASIQESFNVICGKKKLLGFSCQVTGGSYVTFVQCSHLDIQPLGSVTALPHWWKLSIIIIMNHSDQSFSKLNHGVLDYSPALDLVAVKSRTRPVGGKMNKCFQGKKLFPYALWQPSDKRITCLSEKSLES